ncbi:MAG: crosslink repair DNA glycosylase YcaQ family protein, partial [Propionicimonas sp.]
MTASIPVEQLRAARMVSLQLATDERRTPLEVAQWFGALQAQDVASGHWSLGVRCPGATEATVLESFERGDIVRTWPMRGTIHVVPARDVSWMLNLTGSRALSSSVRRRESLGLSPR